MNTAGLPVAGWPRRQVLGAAGAWTAAAALAGCGGARSDGGRTVVAIGFQGPLSGGRQQLGINAYDGVLTAVDTANRQSGTPIRLRLVASDDQGMADQGPAAAQKLIDNPRVLAVVGPVFSGPALSSGPLYSRAGLLAVSPSASSPALTRRGFTTFYRVIAPDGVQGAAAAEYLARALKVSSVYSLDDRSEYGVGLSNALEDALRRRGVTVVHDGINPAKDYQSMATKIIDAAPGAVYYSGYYPELALLATSLRSKGYTGKILSGDGANDDELIREAGTGNAEGILLTCACEDPNSDRSAAAFAAEFRKVNAGTRPGTYSAEAFDATNAIIAVLRRLGPRANRRSVATAFGDVDIAGVTKRIAFTDDGEVRSTAVSLFEVRDGRRIDLGPVDALVRA